MRTHSLAKCCALCVCLGLCSAAQSETKSPPVDASPERLLRQSVQSELDGVDSPRERLLSAAIELTPDHGPAYWHAGKLQWHGQWLPADEVVRCASSDSSLAEYRELRSQLADTSDDHRALARFCTEHDLAEEARVHWVRVLEGVPADREAAKALELRRHEGRVLTADELSDWKQSRAAGHRQRREWRPKFAAWRGAIERGSPQMRVDALAELRQFDDPAGVTALEGVFGAKGTNEKSIRLNLLLVETLGHMPELEATHALVRQAVSNETVQARSAAIDELRKRPLHAFVPQLIAAAPNAFGTRYQLASAESGGETFAHRLLSEGNDTLVVRRAAIRANVVLYDFISIDGAAGTMASGMQDPRFNNAALHDRIRTVLASATPLENLDNPANWERSWYQYNSWDPPQYREEIMRSHSCFPAGTLVPTLAGPLPIEQIKIGDRVLAMDEQTGELGYKAVQRPTRRGMTPTVSIRFAAGAMRSTPGHPFWVIGKGWQVAKHLKPGDRLEAVGESLRVEVVEDDAPAPVFNLVVSDFHTYFVGEQRLLVHDNSPLRAGTALVPGLLADTGPHSR